MLARPAPKHDILLLDAMVFHRDAECHNKRPVESIAYAPRETAEVEMVGDGKDRARRNEEHRRRRTSERTG